MEELSVGILIVSDTAFADASADKATREISDVFDTTMQNNVKWVIRSRQIVPDKLEYIQKVLKDWTDDRKLNLAVLSGGTGFAVKDITPEAVSPLLTKQAPGIVHAMLAASLEVTPFAMMSRPVAGIRDSTLIITLPGSPKGATENLQAVVRLLPHACIQAAGGDSRAIHSKGMANLEKEAGVSGKGLPSREHNKSHRHHHHDHHHHSHSHHMPKPRTQGHRAKGESLGGGSVAQRDRTSPYEMITVSQAHDLIAQNTPALKIVERPVDSSLIGYVLAEDVKSTEAVPAYRASIVDGYAVIHTDGKGIYPVVSVSHARPQEVNALESGKIARITTGAPLPDGATAVVMVEDTLLISATDDGKEEFEVEILAEGIEENENIREVGSDVSIRDVVLRKGDEITAVGGEIGILASVGKSNVRVYQKPIVGILSTGNEVVDHDRPGDLKRGEIRDSNRPTLKAIVSAWGYEVVDLGIAGDTKDSLKSTFDGAFKKVDVVVSTGGVSMGELDLLKPTIEQEFNGVIHVGRITMKPGKPTTFATVDTGVESDNLISKQKLVFSLPGNPASATVTFHLFVLPALRHLSGFNPPNHLLPKGLVTVTHDVKLDTRPEYHRANVTVGRSGALEATSTGGQRSSRVGSMVTANCLLCLPSLDEVGDKRTRIPAGDRVEAILIGRIA